MSADWQEIPLDEFVKKGEIELGRGNIISSIDISKNMGNYPIYSSSAKNNGEMGKYGSYMFDEELISWSVDGGGYFFYRPKHKFSITNVSGFIRLHSNTWNYKFLYYLLDYQHQFMAFDYQTKAHPSVIKFLYYLVPLPIEEQTKIAEILSCIDTAIEQTEAIIAKQQRIKTGLMQDLLSKGIDEHGNIRSEQTHAFKDSPLGRIPVEWDVKFLNDCIRADSPICYGILMPGTGFDDGVPVIKVKDIFDGLICLDDILLTDPSIDSAYKRSRLKENDLLLTIRGTTGRLALVPAVLDGANITQDTARIRLKAEHSPSFFFYLMQSAYIQEQIKLHTLGQAVKGINIAEVRRLLLAVPNYNEQHRINIILECVGSNWKKTTDKLKKLKLQKTALMQDLLSGNVRVNPLLSQQ